jgi:hypothetical protein
METDAAAIAVDGKKAQPWYMPTNLVGNVVATIVIAKWEKALDERKLQQVLNRTVDKAAFAQQPA